MKKIICTLMVITILAFSLIGYCASVTPITMPGNDANHMDYTPPIGCVRTTLPNSNVSDTHVYNFNDNGELDATGTNILTVVVGKATGESYTKVLSWNWSGSYPLYGIIVKGGPNFNLYAYSGSATSDTNLISPVNPGGNIPNISHVSVVLCPTNPPPPPPPPIPPIINICCAIVIGLLLVSIAISLCIMCKLKCCCRLSDKHR